MNIDIGVALIAVAGSLVVGFLSGRTARQTERLRYKRERLGAAYGDYLTSIGEMEVAKRAGAEAQAQAAGRAIAAKARLCVNGSAEVVKALAEFEGRGIGEMRNTMFILVNAMRRDVEADGDVLKEQIGEILFGPPAA